MCAMPIERRSRSPLVTEPQPESRADDTTEHGADDPEKIVKMQPAGSRPGHDELCRASRR